MESELSRIKKRNNARLSLSSISGHKKSTWIIHYSCESFYKEDGRSPRITSIAIRNLESAQTISFSIHQVAELKKYDIEQLEIHYDQLEKILLDSFYDFVRKHSHNYYLHWNMRDVNFGFAAIEHRYKVLGGFPELVEDQLKIDLARVLIGIYGVHYIDHPRLEKIMQLNKISGLNFLNGEAEALAFKNKEYYKLHLSTLRKVDVMANLLERCLDGRLKVLSSWWEVHGIHPKLLLEFILGHWIIAGLIVILGVVASIYQIYDHYHQK